MKVQRALILLTGTACVLAIAPWLLNFWGQRLSPNPADWGVFGDYIGGVLSGPLALAGFIALLITIQQQRAFAKAEQDKANDIKYFESAQQCLRRAHETIKPQDGAPSPPKSRMAWLTTARWLLAAESLANKISETSPSLKEAFELESEHYRMLFMDILKPRQMNSIFVDSSFFSGDDTLSGSEIEERSVRVILNFMEWPDEKSDAIDKVPLYTRKEAEEMHVWCRGFQAYLLNKRRFKSEQS